MAERTVKIIGADYYLENGEVLRPVSLETLRGETGDRRGRSILPVMLPPLNIVPEQMDIDKAGKDLWNPDIRKEDMGF